MLRGDVKFLVDLIISAPPVTGAPSDYNEYAYNFREQLGIEY